MGQVLFIVWRESVEALLIVGILYGWIRHSGDVARRGLPYLIGGVFFGLLLAIAVGAALMMFSELIGGDAQTYFQIVLVLAAAALIVHMVFWMRKNGRGLRASLLASMEAKVSTRTWWGVFFLTALAIAREGSEMAVFLYGIGMGTQTGGALGLGIAAALGLALGFLTFYLLQMGGKFFSWQRFFQVTEIILLLLGSGLFLNGIERFFDAVIESSDALAGANLTAVLTTPVWNSTWLLDESSKPGSLLSSMIGYRGHPALMSVVIYAAYWIGILFALGRLRPAAPGPKTAVAATKNGVSSVTAK